MNAAPRTDSPKRFRVLRIVDLPDQPHPVHSRTVPTRRAAHFTGTRNRRHRADDLPTQTKRSTKRRPVDTALRNPACITIRLACTKTISITVSTTGPLTTGLANAVVPVTVSFSQAICPGDEKQTRGRIVYRPRCLGPRSPLHRRNCGRRVASLLSTRQERQTRLRRPGHN